MSGFSHYTLNKDGGLDTAPAATEGNCVPYLIKRGDQDVLCVIEGGAYHQFDISLAGVARLAEEASARLRRHVTNSSASNP